MNAMTARSRNWRAAPLMNVRRNSTISSLHYPKHVDSRFHERCHRSEHKSPKHRILERYGNPFILPIYLLPCYDVSCFIIPIVALNL